MRKSLLMSLCLVLAGLRTKHKGDASSHLTVCLAFVVSWVGLRIARAVFLVFMSISICND